MWIVPPFHRADLLLLVSRGLGVWPLEQRRDLRCPFVRAVDEAAGEGSTFKVYGPERDSWLCYNGSHG